MNLSLQDPPRSTEQIMHPEKFLQVPADQPKAVGLPDLTGPLGPGWELKETNTLGEFDLNVMLRENGASDPDKGADGWGGGKFEMYKLAQEMMVYSSVVWDTEADAKEFYGCHVRDLRQRPPGKGHRHVDRRRAHLLDAVEWQACGLRRFDQQAGAGQGGGSDPEIGCYSSSKNKAARVGGFIFVMNRVNRMEYNSCDAPIVPCVYPDRRIVMGKASLFFRALRWAYLCSLTCGAFCLRWAAFYSRSPRR